MTTATAKDVLKLMKDKEVKYVDCRFTDPRGKWQHCTYDVSLFEEDAFAEGTLSVVCDVLEPTTGEPYHRDPRSIAKKAVAYMKSTGAGDIAYFGPEAEFFVF